MNRALAMSMYRAGLFTPLRSEGFERFMLYLWAKRK